MPRHENQTGAFDFWMTAHRALRGRYVTAITLALCLGAVGSAIGYSMGQRLYAATGIVRIAAALPPVLKETDQNKTIPNFDGFIQAQKDVMASRETIQAALRTQAWQSAGPGARRSSEAEFSAGLRVETKPRSDHLRITFSHEDPEVAAAGVRSIIAAYRDAFTREQDEFEGGRMSQLRERRTSLATQLQSVETELDQVAQGADLTELDLACVVAGEGMKKLHGSLAQLRGVLAGGPDIMPRQPASERSPEEMARQESIRAASAELSRARAQLAQARSLGLTDEHRLVKRLSSLVSDREELVASLRGFTGAEGVEVRDEDPATSLREREASLSAMVATAEQELREATTRRTRANELSERALTLKSGLLETNARLDSLSVEATSGGRLSVVSGGDYPMTALLDNRAKVAALGGMFGAALPLGMLVLSGCVARRARFSLDLVEELGDRVSFVTALPDLRGRARLAAEAVHRVHDLRLRLQPRTASDRRTLLVSSATPDDGGSDLAVSLALSFVSAGFRTLLIDGDLEVRGLSERFEAGRCPGLLDATGTIDPLIWKTDSGVSFLAAGSGNPGDACRLSPASTGRILSLLRDRFDVVIIDSDSMNEGLDAPTMAPLVDGVVLRTHRGEGLDEIRRAVQRIEASGGVLACVAFAKAAESEIRSKRAGAASGRGSPIQASRFGVLTGAMAGTLGLQGDEDFRLCAVGMSLMSPGNAQRAA
jgi:Mrp family chromosome partitioning ATPase/uncharacterized protein involved in exopolysaccharide biosynthesis